MTPPVRVLVGTSTTFPAVFTSLLFIILSPTPTQTVQQHMMVVGEVGAESSNVRHIRVECFSQQQMAATWSMQIRSPSADTSNGLLHNWFVPITGDEHFPMLDTVEELRDGGNRAEFDVDLTRTAWASSQLSVSFILGSGNLFYYKRINPYDEEDGAILQRTSVDKIESHFPPEIKFTEGENISVNFTVYMNSDLYHHAICVWVTYEVQGNCSDTCEAAIRTRYVYSDWAHQIVDADDHLSVTKRSNATSEPPDTVASEESTEKEKSDEVESSHQEPAATDRRSARPGESGPVQVAPELVMVSENSSDTQQDSPEDDFISSDDRSIDIDETPPRDTTSDYPLTSLDISSSLENITREEHIPQSILDGSSNSTGELETGIDLNVSPETLEEDSEISNSTAPTSSMQTEDSGDNQDLTSPTQIEELEPGSGSEADSGLRGGFLRNNSISVNGTSSNETSPGLQRYNVTSDAVPEGEGGEATASYLEEHDEYAESGEYSADTRSDSYETELNDDSISIIGGPPDTENRTLNEDVATSDDEESMGAQDSANGRAHYNDVPVVEVVLTLTIQDINDDYAGQYICNIYSEPFNKGASFHTQTKAIPKDEEHLLPHGFIIAEISLCGDVMAGNNSDNMTIQAGLDNCLICYSAGNPTPNIAFTKNGEALTLTTANYLVEPTGDPEFRAATYIMHTPGPDDAGIYGCHATTNVTNLGSHSYRADSYVTIHIQEV